MAASPMMPLRAVVVGAGLMGRFHTAAVAAAEGRSQAVVDPDLARARALADGARVATSIAELDDRVDVVHVCTPAETHVEIVGAAPRRGSARDRREAGRPDAAATAALLDAAGRHGSMLVPVHQFVFQRGIQRLLRERERLGTIVRVEFEAATAGAEAGAIEPDELVEDILPHPLALFARLADAELSELDWLVRRPAPGEPARSRSRTAPRSEIAISTRGRPTRARLGVTGTSASAEADLYHGFAVFEAGDVSRARKAHGPSRARQRRSPRPGGTSSDGRSHGEAAYPGLRELVQRTYEAIATGAPPPIGAEETLAVALARDRLLGR